MTYEQHRVGLNAALAGIIVLIATKFGIDIPNGVAVALVGAVAIISTHFSPGWAERTGLKAYPAGITAAAVTVLAWLLPALGINALSQADLVTLAGAIPFIVSMFTPATEPIDDLGRVRVGADDDAA
jgi:hypothetical protein